MTLDPCKNSSNSVEMRFLPTKDLFAFYAKILPKSLICTGFSSFLGIIPYPIIVPISASSPYEDNIGAERIATRGF